MSRYSSNRSEEHKKKLKENHRGFQNLTVDELEEVFRKRRENPNWWNDEHRRKIKEHNQKKAQDPEWRKRQSEITKAYYDRIGRTPKIEKVYPESGYGKRKSEEHRVAISNGLKGKKHPTKECQFCGKIVSASNHSRWHGEKCKEKNVCR